MRLAVAAGGSGGHVYPALAVLEELRAMGKLAKTEGEISSPVVWIGNPNGIEARILSAYPWIEFLPLRTRGLARRQPWTWPLCLTQIGAFARSLSYLKRFRPDVVLGMGGFPSLAPALAAKVLGIPLVIHEQNANMGLANRLLSPIADRVLLSFSETRGSERFTQFLGKRRKNFIVTGNPVRREIIEKSKGKLGQELLVMGGSGGSRRIIEAIVQAAPSLAQVQGLRLRLATGRAATAQEVTEKLRRVGLAAEVVDYIDDMAEVLSRAKLVLARAGATTVAEIAASGRPAILIPWDGAAADHQRLNAEAQARSGGFIVISQGELGQVDLGKFIESLWQDEERLSQLSASSRAESRPDAARRVALVLIEVARERK